MDFFLNHFLNLSKMMITKLIAFLHIKWFFFIKHPQQIIHILKRADILNFLP